MSTTHPPSTSPVSSSVSSPSSVSSRVSCGVAVAQRGFWERFFAAGNDGEWYLPSGVVLRHLGAVVTQVDVIVHGGEGASLLVHKVSRAGCADRKSTRLNSSH